MAIGIIVFRHALVAKKRGNADMMNFLSVFRARKTHWEEDDV